MYRRFETRFFDYKERLRTSVMIKGVNSSEKQSLLKELVQRDGIGALVRLRVSGLLSADTCCKDFF